MSARDYVWRRSYRKDRKEEERRKKEQEAKGRKDRLLLPAETEGKHGEETREGTDRDAHSARRRWEKPSGQDQIIEEEAEEPTRKQRGTREIGRQGSTPESGEAKGTESRPPEEEIGEAIDDVEGRVARMWQRTTEGICKSRKDRKGKEQEEHEETDNRQQTNEKEVEEEGGVEQGEARKEERNTRIRNKVTKTTEEWIQQKKRKSFFERWIELGGWKRTDTTDSEEEARPRKMT